MPNWSNSSTVRTILPMQEDKGPIGRDFRLDIGDRFKEITRRGSQYRSVIFADSDEQMTTAKAMTEEVQKAHYPNKKIATELVMASDHKWYTAEEVRALLLA